MLIQKNEFLQILNQIKPGISQKGILSEETTCFIFSGENIISFNDKICFAYPFISNFSCSVPADELIKVIQNSISSEITLECSEKELIIKTDKFKAGITIIKNSILENLPIQNIKDKKWKKCPENFIAGISLCLFSAAKNNAVSYLNCIVIKNNQIISSDNFRISCFDLSEEMPEFLIPLSSAIELSKQKEINEYYLDNSWIYFKNTSGLLFLCRIINEEFPDVSSFFDISAEATEIILPSDILKQAIETSSVFSNSIDDVDIRIEITIENNVVFCKGANQKGWVEYSIGKSKNPDLSFFIHPDFLKSLIEIMTEIKLDDNKLYIEADNFRHVVTVKCK